MHRYKEEYLTGEVTHRGPLACRFQLSAAVHLHEALDVRPDLRVVLADLGARGARATLALDELNDRFRFALELVGRATDPFAPASSNRLGVTR